MTVVDGLRKLLALSKNIPQHAPEVYVNKYLEWVEEVEGALTQFFVDPPIEGEVLTGRYWNIRDQGVDAPRTFPLVNLEVQRLSRYLERIAMQLERELAGFDDTSVALLLDTNVFLHFKRFDQLKWPELAEAKHVRLVIVLAVLDELDAKTYGASDKLAQRAKAVLRTVDTLREGVTVPEQPVTVRPGVEMQILPDPRGHERYPNTDDEIIRRAEHVDSLTGGRSRVVSADRGMRTRAQTRDLICLRPPDDWQLPVAEGRLPTHS